MKIVLALIFVVGLFFSLFLAMGIGMAVSERAANVFATCVLVAVVIIVWSGWWFSKKGEP